MSNDPTVHMRLEDMMTVIDDHLTDLHVLAESALHVEAAAPTDEDVSLTRALTPDSN